VSGSPGRWGGEEVGNALAMGLGLSGRSDFAPPWDSGRQDACLPRQAGSLSYGDGSVVWWGEGEHVAEGFEAGF
jgi:hypothetical protein